MVFYLLFLSIVVIKYSETKKLTTPLSNIQNHNNTMAKYKLIISKVYYNFTVRRIIPIMVMITISIIMIMIMIITNNDNNSQQPGINNITIF